MKVGDLVRYKSARWRHRDYYRRLSKKLVFSAWSGSNPGSITEEEVTDNYLEVIDESR